MTKTNSVADFYRNVDADFHRRMKEDVDHIHDDPQLEAIFKRFGADAFRRSSGVEPFDPFLKRINFSGDRCVEIGTYNGITAIILARYFKEVVSIDIFPHTAKHAIAEFVGVTNVRFVDIKDNEEKADIINGLDFDAAYSDGDHSNDTQLDFDLVKRCRRVLFHEYWDIQTPVYNLVNSLKQKRGKVIIDGKFAYWEGRK